MKNLSGNAASWAPKKDDKDTEETGVKENQKRTPLDTKGHQEKLKSIIKELSSMYEKAPCKELYDVEVYLQLALSAIENVS